MGSSSHPARLIAKMLNLLLATSLPLLVVGSSDYHHPRNVKMPAPLGQGTGNEQYKPVDPSYSTPDEVYKAGDKDDCLPYVEKTCFTQQQEQCKDVYEKNCTAVIDEFEERECFDVTELMCSLAESIQYEMVDETYTVQRCTGVTDRVCDTVYDLAQSTKDD